jgi:hypothetical protein
VNGVRPIATPVCSGTGCQGVPAPSPVFATPASVTFEGVGNFPEQGGKPTSESGKARSLTRAQKLSRALSACHKKQARRQRSICEAKAHKLYGPKVKAKAKAKAKKATVRGAK